jgi:dipeptidyl aminopeptidase/acylaminoacyl peptidase
MDSQQDNKVGRRAQGIVVGGVALGVAAAVAVVTTVVAHDPGTTQGAVDPPSSPATASSPTLPTMPPSPATEIAHPGAIRAGLLGKHSRILFEYTDGEILDRLWIMRADGTHAAMVEPPPHYVTPDAMSHADVAPDGRSIVFTTTRDPVDDLWTLDLTTGRGHRLLRCAPRTCVEYVSPSYSPDGTQVAVTEFAAPPSPGVPPRTSQILILDLASGATRVIATSRLDGYVDHARWSPDGSHLVVDVGDVDGSWIATVPTDGSGTLTAITPKDLHAATPDWSPAGDLIVFCTWGDDQEPRISDHSDLWTVRPDGSGLTRLLASDHSFRGELGDRYTHPLFTLNGKGVLATWTHGMTAKGWKQRRIVVVPLADGGPILLTADDGVGPAAAWNADGLAAHALEMP